MEISASPGCLKRATCNPAQEHISNDIKYKKVLHPLALVEGFDKGGSSKKKTHIYM